MSHEDQIMSQLQSMETLRLQAIYNNAWRNQHNGIKESSNLIVMALIEIVIGSRGLMITGNDGTYEFHVMGGDK